MLLDQPCSRSRTCTASSQHGTRTGRGCLLGGPTRGTAEPMTAPRQLPPHIKGPPPRVRESIDYPGLPDFLLDRLTMPFEYGGYGYGSGGVGMPRERVGVRADRPGRRVPRPRRQLRQRPRLPVGRGPPRGAAGGGARRRGGAPPGGGGGAADPRRVAAVRRVGGRGRAVRPGRPRRVRRRPARRPAAGGGRPRLTGRRVPPAVLRRGAGRRPPAQRPRDRPGVRPHPAGRPGRRGAGRLVLGGGDAPGRRPASATPTTRPAGRSSRPAGSST
jgi:hypothetical protein